MNIVIVQGVLSRPPEERDLPSGARVVAYEVSASRGECRAEPVPVAWTDPPPSALALVSGDEVVVVGRVRRRYFRAGGSTQSRTEVVADTVLRASQRRRVTAALRQAASVLSSG